MKIKKDKVSQGKNIDDIKIIPNRVVIEKYKNTFVMYIKEDNSYQMKEFELPYYMRYGYSVVKITPDNILEFSDSFGKSYKDERMVRLLPELFQYATPITEEEFNEVRNKYLQWKKQHFKHAQAIDYFICQYKQEIHLLNMYLDNLKYMSNNEYYVEIPTEPKMNLKINRNDLKELLNKKLEEAKIKLDHYEKEFDEI